MELQFDQTNLACMARALREVKEQELTQEIRLTDGMPDVGRVLAAWGQPILRSKEWRGDQISVSGGLMTWALYAPEDGSEPRCVDAWIPFQFKWDVGDVGREGPVRIASLLRFVDGRTVSARKIMIRAALGCLAEAMYPHQSAVYAPREVPEDVQLLRRGYPIRLPREAGEKTFQLEEELAMPGAVPVQELLSYTLRPEVTDRRITGDNLALRGLATLHLVYRCREGRIRTHDFELPFSQLAELEEQYGSDAGADVMMGVTGLELEPGEDDCLRLKAGLVAQYMIHDRSMVELTEDAYSPNRQVEVRKEELKLPMILEEGHTSVTAKAAFPGMDVQAADVTFWPWFPRQRQGPDGIELELTGQFQLLGTNGEGTLQSAVAHWDGQERIPADEDSRMDLLVMPTGPAMAVSGPEGMEAKAELSLRTHTTTDRGLPMVTGLELGEIREADPNRPSLILCRADGERLWDLAKRSGSTVDAIRLANGLEEELMGNRMLLIPVS
ncbi:MAG: DUF3794 domain-containing protein [Oscillospiraceae bacterium]|nr:DUF3794 domain-containing protein [Oscillospiraceae bacterium]